MRDLRIQADLARPPAATLQQTLEHLLVHCQCPDFTLVYEGCQFPTHKSVLLARCPYFKDLLLAAGSLATPLGGQRHIQLVAQVPLHGGVSQPEHDAAADRPAHLPREGVRGAQPARGGPGASLPVGVHTNCLLVFTGKTDQDQLIVIK